MIASSDFLHLTNTPESPKYLGMTENCVSRKLFLKLNGPVVIGNQ